MARKSFVFLVVGIVVLFLCSVSSAVVPDKINYQGKLATSGGGCLNDTVSMTFTIYSDDEGTVVDWTEDQDSVIVKEGIFNVLLGSETPIPTSVFDGSTKYLGIQVESDPEMRPLKPIVSVAYAYRAGTADGGGGDDGDWTFQVTDTADTTLMTGGAWGIARYGNTLWGSADSTHVNLGVACTTGSSGFDYKYCTVGGGSGNTASGREATVGGGWGNTASGSSATVGGGFQNTSGSYATVAGGWQNTASGEDATVGGGSDNTASGIKATVGGGGNNFALNQHTTVGGGESNNASGLHATVGGGRVNNGGGDYAAVGGGFDNVASGNYATVGGGRGNTTSGYGATVGGGYHNTATGEYATAPGGYADTAAGDYSMAAGRRVRITSDGDNTFAFGRDFSTSTPNAVIFHNSVDPIKVGIGTTNPQGTLDVSSTTGALIVPRMTTAQRNALTAVNGMVIYNTTDNQFNFYENGAWVTK